MFLKVIFLVFTNDISQKNSLFVVINLYEIYDRKRRAYIYFNYLFFYSI